MPTLPMKATPIPPDAEASCRPDHRRPSMDGPAGVSPCRGPRGPLTAPDVPLEHPVGVDLLDVVVGLGEGDVFGEDVRVLAAGGRPVVHVAVAGVVGRQRAHDAAVPLQALAEVPGAELHAPLGPEE